MNNFGKLKDKILKKLTESYSKNDSSEMKKILKLIKENKEFKELYLFYESVEDLNLSYPGAAELYVESFENIFPGKIESVKDICEKISKYVSDVDVEFNELYENLDIMAQKTTLTNLDKKVNAKRKLIEHLTKKKEIKNINESQVYSGNEKLLMAILSNNFNITYDNSLNESEKNELKNILSLTNDDLNSKVSDLKETVLNKVSSLLNESNDIDLLGKLNSVKEEVSTMLVTKYNYYRLTQLKNGLE
jgi:hypothetical protein